MSSVNPKCSRCHIYFIPTIKTSGLPYESCEKCRKSIKEMQKGYYQNNTDKIKEYKKENADKIKEYKREYNKEYRKENADKIKEYNKERFQKVKNIISLYLVQLQRRQINRCFKNSHHIYNIYLNFSLS
jgi:hypothetical protein